MVIRRAKQTAIKKRPSQVATDRIETLGNIQREISLKETIRQPTDSLLSRSEGFRQARRRLDGGGSRHPGLDGRPSRRSLSILRWGFYRTDAAPTPSKSAGNLAAHFGIGQASIANGGGRTAFEHGGFDSHRGELLLSMLRHAIAPW